MGPIVTFSAPSGGSPSRNRPRVVVLAPAPLLTVTVESSTRGDEIHFHPGGQGVWIARLVASLGVESILCSTFGGETGQVIEALLKGWGIEVRPVSAEGWNGTYIHDRRSGKRVIVAQNDVNPRSRHDVDELYGVAFAAGLEADVVVLGGPETTRVARGEVPEAVPIEIYSRLARDLRRNGVTVVVDLCGEVLEAALGGGVDVVKVSDEELEVTGEVPDTSTGSLVEAMKRLRSRGAEAVVVTCAERPILASIGNTIYELRSPGVDPIDDRGAGDSVTAGTTAALASGSDLIDAVRFGAAAGALNVTRRGLGSGSRREIELLARHVEVTELRP
jgi:1-phosphofructokinase